jgi:hypothetical protein
LPNADKPFSPALMLDDVFNGRNQAHAVNVSLDNAQVRIGRDYLRFNITSSKPGYLYVLYVGTNNKDFELLFPNAADKSNRVTPGKVMKLPRAGWPLKASGPAGTDQFVAIVSEEPRDFSSLKPGAEDVFQQFPLVTGERLYRAYTGSTPLYAGTVSCGGRPGCSEAYGAVRFSIEEIPATIAESPPIKPPASPGKRPESSPDTKASPATEARPSRCSDILQRSSLGESISAEEQAFLRRECR